MAPPTRRPEPAAPAARAGFRRGARGIVAVAITGVLAGCAGVDPASGPGSPERREPAAPAASAVTSAPTTVPAPPPDTRSPEERAGADALAAYKAFWAAETAAARAGEADSPRMRRYGTDPLLGQLRSALAGLADQGIRQTGELKLRPEVAKVDLDASPATVTIEDCFDERGLGGISRDGTPVDVDRSPPYELTATVIRVGGRWRVSESVPHTSRRC